MGAQLGEQRVDDARVVRMLDVTRHHRSGRVEIGGAAIAVDGRLDSCRRRGTEPRQELVPRHVRHFREDVAGQALEEPRRGGAVGEIRGDRRAVRGRRQRLEVAVRTMERQVVHAHAGADGEQQPRRPHPHDPVAVTPGSRRRFLSRRRSPGRTQ